VTGRRSAHADDGAEVAAARARLERLVRRLRGFSPRAWAHGGRAVVVRRLAVDLAAIAAPDRALPEVPDHALADVVAVIGHDAIDAVGNVADIRRLLDEALDATR
jgi:hypothetical protein